MESTLLRYPRVFYVEEGQTPGTSWIRRGVYIRSLDYAALSTQRLGEVLDIGPWGAPATVCLSMPTSIHILFSNEGFISDGGEILQTLQPFRTKRGSIVKN
jgi:hypothetical protein